jgi:hypothetical protein
VALLVTSRMPQGRLVGQILRAWLEIRLKQGATSHASCLLGVSAGGGGSIVPEPGGRCLSLSSYG